MITIKDKMCDLMIFNRMEDASERDRQIRARRDSYPSNGAWKAFCDLEAESNCGQDCVRILSLLPFLEIQFLDSKERAADLVLHQCYVYYFG